MPHSPRIQSTSRGFFPADVTVHPPNENTPRKKATAGYYLGMKYAASEERFHSGMRLRAVYFYKDGMRWKFAVNLEENVTGGAVPAAAPWSGTAIPGTQF